MQDSPSLLATFTCKKNEESMDERCNGNVRSQSKMNKAWYTKQEPL